VRLYERLHDSGEAGGIRLMRHFCCIGRRGGESEKERAKSSRNKWVKISKRRQHWFRAYHAACLAVLQTDSDPTLV
jgi:hypothetical protein